MAFPRHPAMLLLAALLLAPACARRGAPTEGAAAPAAANADERAVTAVVTTFGDRLKMVSVLGPPDTVRDDVRRHYGDLVTPALLDEWLRDPALAPGRQVSSPHPERIEITNASVRGDRAKVSGEIVEVTVEKEVARIPVRVALTRERSRWKISAFEPQASDAQSSESSSSGSDDPQTEAVAVLLDYYAAIDRGDYDRAYRAWGSKGPPGQTLAEFRKGFENTARVHVQAGSASRIEGAAGSRYIEIPVTVTAFSPEGKEQRFDGTYTLRRSVVDGAAEADRVWHIDRANLREVSER